MQKIRIMLNAFIQKNRNVSSDKKAPAKWLGLALALALVSNISIASNTATAQTNTTNAAQNRAQLLADFVNGADLAEGSLASSAQGKNSEPALMSSQLVQAQQNFLNAFETQIARPEGVLNKAQSAFNALPDMSVLQPKFRELMLQHTLYQAHFQRLQQRLLDAKASTKHLSRLQAAQQNYAQQATPLLSELEALLFADPEAESSLVQRFSGQQRLWSLATQLRELSQQSSEQMPILRFSDLPFQALALPPQAVQLEPALVASYASPNAAEPNPEDSQTADIQPAVYALAEELGYDPIAIYEYVYTQIQTRWYAGSMLSPAGVIAQGEGNSVDQAALLSALFRASSIPTRFVSGVIDVPSDDLLAMVAVDDINQATRVLQRAGIAFEAIRQAGQVRAVQMQHTWLSVYVPYTNYRGASVDRSGQVWLGLMPAIKATSRTAGGSLLRNSAFSVENLQADFFRQVQTQDVVQQLQERVSALLNEQGLNEQGNVSGLESQLDRLSLSVSGAGYLPNSLPVSVVAVTNEQAQLPNELVHTVRFIVYRDTSENAVIMDATVPVSRLANQSLSLSYQAGSQDDHDLILNLGGIGRTPLYLVDLRPQIKLQGVPIAVGEQVLPAGVSHRIAVEFSGPVGDYRVDKVVRSGNFHGIGISAQGSVDLSEQSNNVETSGGQILSQIALRYLNDWAESERALSELLKRRLVRPLPTLVFASNDVSVGVEAILSQPQSLEFNGVNLDAALRVTDSLAARSDAFSESEFATLSALQGSYLEHAIFERLFAVDSISADKGLALATQAGIAVLSLSNADLADLDSTLAAHPSTVQNAVRGWLELGFEVRIPESPLDYLEWQGSVWVVTDALTGDAGYFITQGLAGGSTAEPFPQDIADLLASPDTDNVNIDPSQAVSLTLAPNSNFQVGRAGEEFETLEVLARDAAGRPVRGVPVLFDRGASVGEFVLEQSDPSLPTTANRVTVLTNAEGVAQATYRSPERILDSPDVTFTQSIQQGVAATRIALNYLEVSATLPSSTVLRADTFFTLFTEPGAATQIVHLSEQGRGLAGSVLSPLGFERVVALDEFDNEVANVPLNLSTGEIRGSQINSEAVILPHRILTPDCEGIPVFATPCGQTSTTFMTDSFGRVSVGIIFGSVRGESGNILPAIYPINVSLDEQNNVEIPFNAAFSSVFVQRGPSQFAAVRPGEAYLGSAQAGTTTRPSNERYAAQQVNLNGGVFDSAFSSIGNFIETVSSGFGAAAQIEYNGLSAGDSFGAYRPSVDWERSIADSNGAVERIEQVTQPIDAGITALSISPETLSPIELSTQALEQRFEPIRYTQEPNSYEALYESLELFEDDELIQRVIAVDGQATLPPLVFDPEKTYTAEVVFNGGTQFDEVRSDRFELPVQAPVIAEASGSGAFVVDRVNQASCAVDQPTFSLTLLEEAIVTIDTLKPRSSVPENFINQQVLPAGVHQFDATESDFRRAFLREGVTQVFITAQSTETGRVDEIESRFTLTQNNIQPLPVGSPSYENVNLSNGSLFFSRNDLQVSGRGPNIEFTRSYSSANRSASSLGPGWSHNYESYAQLNECGWVTLSGSAAGGITFFPQNDGSFRPGRGYHGTLQRDGNDWDFYAKDGTRYHYSQRFVINLAPINDRSRIYLEYIEDTNGNRTTLTYSQAQHSAPQLELITDASGRQIRLEYQPLSTIVREASGASEASSIDEVLLSASAQLYDFERNLITRISGLDYDIRYRYDEHGRLVEAINAELVLDLDREPSTFISEQYQYQTLTDAPTDFNSFEFDLPDAVVIRAIVDYRNITTEYTHERLERELLLSFDNTDVTLPYTTQESQVTQITKRNELPLDGDDIVSLINYIDRQTSNELPQVEITDPRGVLYRYSLDLLGRQVSLEGPTGTKLTTWTENDSLMLSDQDENGVLTTYQYDADGNVTSEEVTGPNGGTFTISSRYERRGEFGQIRNLLHQRTDRRGNTTNYRYDERGNLLTITHPATPACNAPCNETFTYRSNGDRLQYFDERNKRTRYFYDEFGNVERSILPIGTTRAEYDQRSRLIESTDENGNVTRMEYDWLNRLTERTNAEGGVRRYAYDPSSNKVLEVDEEGREMVVVYDFDDRVIEKRTEFVGNAQSQSIRKTMRYDPNGNETSMTDYRGNVMSYEFDDANRVVLERYPANEQGLVKTRAYVYDNTSNVLRSTIAGVAQGGDQVTAYEYDNLYRQTRITDAEGGITQIRYDGNDNVIEQIDELGRVMQYDYDAMNRKVAQRDAVGSAVERAMAWEYDRASNLLVYTDARGNTETHAYDDKNRRIFHTNLDENRYVYEYDDYGNLTDEFDHFGNHIQYAYDELHRRVRVIDQRGFVSTTDYDLVGNPISDTQFNGNVITREFDFLNRPISEADSIGPLMAYTYDDDNNPLSHTDGKGFVTRYRYDALSQRTEEAQPENRTLQTQYDVFGNVSQSTDGENNTTRYEYDRLNRQTRLIDALNQTTTTVYDAVDNALRITDKRGNTTEHDYDELNRVTQTREPQAGDHSRVIQNVYDPNNNVVQSTDKRGIVTRVVYDRLNRVIEETRNNIVVIKNTYSEIGDLIGLEDANGNVTAMEYNERHEMVLESRPETAISTVTYDAMGDVLTMRDPENRLTTYEYDLRQRKTAEINGEGERSRYAYDLNNNQIRHTRPEQNRWEYAYDELDRLIQITDADNQLSQKTYDRQNNQLSHTDANGNQTLYEYDALNRKSIKRYPLVAGQTPAICTYQYDENNNLLIKTDANGQIDTHTYDALNRLTNTVYTNAQQTVGRDMVSESMAYDGNNNVIEVVENYSLTNSSTETRTDTRSYDDFDRLFNRTDSFNKTIQYRYDLNGNRTSLTDSDGLVTTYRFDGLNRVTDVTTQQGRTGYSYDRSSLLVQTTYPNNTTATYEYDQAKRTTRIHNQQNNATVSNFEYEFDENGNRITQRETNGGAEETTTYQYDANDRLLEVSYDVQGCTNVPNAGCVGGTPDVTTTYTYDPAYNRTSEIDTTNGSVTKNKTYRYNARNQLTEVDDNLDNSNNVAYAFDQNGNQIQKVKGVGTASVETTNFIFDIRDDLREVQIGGSTVGQFLYNYDGLRIEKIGERGAERSTYDDQAILQQYEVSNCAQVGDANCLTGSTGQTRAKFDYGASKLLSLNTLNEPTQFYLYDTLMSVANLTNSDGAVQARYQYDAWGIKRNEVGQSYNRFSFTGYEEDTETGLLYAKARYYDPDNGKFLSEDAWAGDQLIAPSLHKYLYAYQNPTVWVDPTGNNPEHYRYLDENGRVAYSDKAGLKQDAEAKRKQKQVEQAALEEQQAQADAREQAIRQKNADAVSDKIRQADAKQEAINAKIGERNIQTRKLNEKLSPNADEITTSQWQVGIKEAIVTESHRGVTPETDFDREIRQRQERRNDLKGPINTVGKTGELVGDILTPVPGAAPIIVLAKGGKALKSGQKIATNGGRNWKGSGPVPGVIGIHPGVKSTKALQNYVPKGNGGIEFVFDPKTKTFVTGKPKNPREFGLTGSPHQQLAGSIGADTKTVVGGTLTRGKKGEFITTENSGHYGQNWTPEVRKAYKKYLESSTGKKVEHEVWE